MVINTPKKNMVNFRKGCLLAIVWWFKKGYNHFSLCTHSNHSVPWYLMPSMSHATATVQNLKEARQRGLLIDPNISFNTHSFLGHIPSWKTLSRGITAWPRNTSSPISTRCMTLSTRLLLIPPASSSPGRSSKEHSSLHCASSAFSTRPVVYFSLPTWMMV